MRYVLGCMSPMWRQLCDWDLVYVGILYAWGVVLVRFCISMVFVSMVLYQWSFVSVGFCISEVLYTYGFVSVGFLCQYGFVSVEFCVSWVLYQ